MSHHQALRKIGVTLFTILLMLLTCEVATRLFARLPRDVTERHPEIGRRFQPDLQEHIYNPEAAAAVYFQTNQFGFRGPKISEKKPAGVKRVAVLGDSYTASEGLSEDRTFCAQLQRLLNKSEAANTWEILNFGMPGSGTGQELALYRHVVRKLNVDIVLIAFGNATDIRDNSGELTSNPLIQFAVDEQGDLVQHARTEGQVSLSNWLNRNSRFYYWQKPKVRMLTRHLVQSAGIQHGRQLIYLSHEPPAYTRAWKLTERILDVFDDECRADGCRLYVAAMPSAWQARKTHFEELQEKHHDLELDPLHPDHRLRDICRRLHIPYRTLTTVFRDYEQSAAGGARSQDLFFNGRHHFNDRGSQVIAKELSGWLKTRRLAGGPRPVY